MAEAGPASDEHGHTTALSALLAAVTEGGSAETVAAIIASQRDKGGAEAVTDLVGSQADDTGISPLMIAAKQGDEAVVRCVSYSLH